MINEIKDDTNPFLFSLEYIIDNEVVGYLKFTYMYDRMEIEDLKVLDLHKRRSIGSLLIETLLEKSVLYDVKNITLEVDATNKIAISLYTKYGFKQVAVREKYYDNSDGLLMEKK